MKVYSSVSTGVRILGEEGDGCVSDEYCIDSLGCVDGICTSNYTLNLTVVNSSLVPIDAIINIYNNNNNTLIYSTTNSTNESYDLYYGKKYNLSIKTNTSNCSEILVENILNEDDGSSILFGISEISFYSGFEQMCSVNPMINEFDSYKLTINHSLGNSRAIYKCTNWNFTEDLCIDDSWEKVKIIKNNETSTIIDNLNYSDPGYGIKSCCGDGVCDVNEDISICPEDCGKTTTSQYYGGNSGILFSAPSPPPIIEILKIDLINNINTIERLEQDQSFIILHSQGNIKGHIDYIKLNEIGITLTKEKITKKIIINNQGIIDVSLDDKLISPYVRLGFFEFIEKNNNFENNQAMIYFEDIFSEDYKKPTYIAYEKPEDLNETKQYPFNFYLTNYRFFLVLLLFVMFFLYPLFLRVDYYDYCEDEENKYNNEKQGDAYES